MINIQKSLSWYASALITALLIAYFWPVSHWLDVRSITVSDAAYGHSPKMIVDRQIKIPFFATWQVELERENSFGRFVFVRKADGANSYTTSLDLPDDLNLDWWTYPKRFNIDPGNYRIETCWRIKVYAIPKPPVCVLSNTFTIGHQK